MNNVFVTEAAPVSSGKSYLSGEPVPAEISAETQRVDSENRKSLKGFVKSGAKPVHLLFNIVKPEIAVAMNSVSDFKRDRYELFRMTYCQNSQSFLLFTQLASVACN